MRRHQTAYQHYLNEDALNSVTRSKVFRRLTWYWTLAYAFSIVPELLLGGFGIRINFTKAPENIFYIMALSILLLSLLCTMVFLIIASKYHFFKRKSILFVIAFSPLAAVITSFLTSFTAIKSVNAEGVIEYNQVIHIVFQFFIALPLFVIYCIFCYYAFYDRCSKLTYSLLKKEHEIHKQEAKEANEKLKKEVFNEITYRFYARKAKKKDEEEEK